MKGTDYVKLIDAPKSPHQCLVTPTLKDEDRIRKIRKLNSRKRKQVIEMAIRVGLRAMLEDEVGRDDSFAAWLMTRNPRHTGGRN